MSVSLSPQPGERVNTAAILVPVHTLSALLAAALAWEIDTEAEFPGLIWPQIGEATKAAYTLLSDNEAATVTALSNRLMQERLEAERG